MTKRYKENWVGMFKSFFPQPVWFFSSLILWFIINLVL